MKLKAKIIVKTLLIAVCLQGWQAGWSYADGGSSGSKLVIQMNNNYGQWTSGNDPKKEGQQNYSLMTFSFQKPRYGFHLITSYAMTKYAYNGAKNDFDLSTPLDSTFSAYYKFNNVSGFDLRLGLDFNLPTGHASFTTSEINSLFIDNIAQDLNLATSFGKGLNIAPNLVVSRKLGNNVLGLGARMEFTGEYDLTLDTNDGKSDPGDTFQLFGSLQHLFSEEAMLFLDLSAVLSSRDRQDGADVFKQGNIYTISLRLVDKYTDRFRGTWAMNYGLQDKNQSLGTTGITTENRNSNNNSLEFFFNGGFNITGTSTLNAIIAYKKIYSNGYSYGDSLYDGGYIKYLGGLGLTYVFSKKFFIRADLRGAIMENEADVNESTKNTYKVINIGLGFVYTFEN